MYESDQVILLLKTFLCVWCLWMWGLLLAWHSMPCMAAPAHLMPWAFPSVLTQNGHTASLLFMPFRGNFPCVCLPGSRDLPFVISGVFLLSLKSSRQHSPQLVSPTHGRWSDSTACTTFSYCIPHFPVIFISFIFKGGDISPKGERTSSWRMGLEKSYSFYYKAQICMTIHRYISTVYLRY